MLDECWNYALELLLLLPPRALCCEGMVSSCECGNIGHHYCRGQHVSSLETPSLWRGLDVELDTVRSLVKFVCYSAVFVEIRSRRDSFISILYCSMYQATWPVCKLSHR
jgi:hypothetical protein